MATNEQRRMTLEAFLELPDEKPALELEADRTVTQSASRWSWTLSIVRC
jgi:hypothetical protein